MAGRDAMPVPASSAKGDVPSAMSAMLQPSPSLVMPVFAAFDSAIFSLLVNKSNIFG